jgi:hypothetical protein
MRKHTRTEPHIAPDIDIAKPTEDEIGALAYQLWNSRGCPIGSPEEDWFSAEMELMNHQKVSIIAA